LGQEVGKASWRERGRTIFHLAQIGEGRLARLLDDGEDFFSQAGKDFRVLGEGVSHKREERGSSITSGEEDVEQLVLN
jgi:hypothetical protein